MDRNDEKAGEEMVDGVSVVETRRGGAHGTDGARVSQGGARGAEAAEARCDAVRQEVSVWTKLGARVLSAYYGKPVLDLKLILLVGAEAEMAVRFLRVVLESAGKRTAVMIKPGELKMTMLHKFLSEAWKAGASYAVVAVPEVALDKNVFYGLPVKMIGVFGEGWKGEEAGGASQEDDKNEKTGVVGRVERIAEFCAMKAGAKVVVETEDDGLVEEMMKVVPDEDLIGYGRMPGAMVRTVSFKGYKKGVEVKMMREGEFWTVATFETMGGNVERLAKILTGVAVMAGELGVAMEKTVEAIADYEPKE